jgi:hypothetical protein
MVRARAFVTASHGAGSHSADGLPDDFPFAH